MQTGVVDGPGVHEFGYLELGLGTRERLVSRGGAHLEAVATVVADYQRLIADGS